MATNAKSKAALMLTAAVAGLMPGLLWAKGQGQVTQVSQETTSAVTSAASEAASATDGEELPPSTAITQVTKHVMRLDQMLRDRIAASEKEFLGDSSRAALLDMIASNSGGPSPTSSGLGQDQQETTVVTVLREKATKLKQTVLEIEEWQKQLGRIQGRGAVDEMMAKAEQWNMECKYRRELHAQASELIKCAEKMLLLRLMELKQDRQELATVLVLLNSEQGAQDAPKVTAEDTVNLDNGFEYFEVKESATLREISALSNVYSDARLWHRLYAANRERVENLQADRDVPAGTVLVVPGLVTARRYDF